MVRVSACKAKRDCSYQRLKARMTEVASMRSRVERSYNKAIEATPLQGTIVYASIAQPCPTGKMAPDSCRHCASRGLGHCPPQDARSDGVTWHAGRPVAHEVCARASYGIMPARRRFRSFHTNERRSREQLQKAVDSEQRKERLEQENRERQLREEVVGLTQRAADLDKEARCCL